MQNRRLVGLGLIGQICLMMCSFEVPSGVGLSTIQTASACTQKCDLKALWDAYQKAKKAVDDKQKEIDDLWDEIYDLQKKIGAKKRELFSLNNLITWHEAQLKYHVAKVWEWSMNVAGLEGQLKDATGEDWLVIWGKLEYAKEKLSYHERWRDNHFASLTYLYKKRTRLNKELAQLEDQQNRNYEKMEKLEEQLDALQKAKSDAYKAWKKCKDSQSGS